MTAASLAVSLTDTGDRTRTGRLALILLALLLVLTAIVSLGVGPAALSPARVVEILLSGPRPSEANLGDTVIVWQIRLPRILLGCLVGASLACGGALMQGLFRNPLADPGLAGVSSGSALAAVAVIVLGGGILDSVLGPWTLPFAAFFGGLASTALLYTVATSQGRTAIATMLLAGIALGALAGALTGFLVFLSDDRQLRDITFWSLGGLGGASWERLWTCGPIMLAAILASPFLARGLNALVLSEAEAFHLGLSVQRLKRLAIVIVAAGTAASVAAAGVVGFVGIVVPHLLRLAVGADHRFLLPASALLGAILILVADMAARTLASPAELPIGILTAILGAPFFLWLLLRRRGFSEL